MLRPYKRIFIWKMLYAGGCQRRCTKHPLCTTRRKECETEMTHLVPVPLTTPNAQPSFTLWVTMALVLSLGGDVALMFESNRAFLIGLVSFLLAHVVYCIAFTVPNGFYPQDLLTGAVLLVVAVAVYLYLRPGLGSTKGPVLLYIVVLCFMVNRAASAFFGDAFTITQAWLMTVGAILFLLSDLVLAINRFRHPLEKHRLSLFLYYGGQLLIALSPSYF